MGRGLPTHLSYLYPKSWGSVQCMPLGFRSDERMGVGENLTDKLSKGAAMASSPHPLNFVVPPPNSKLC
jgi:hypothetical protein